jgi:hypothetical protein
MAVCWDCMGWNVGQRRLISPVNLASDTCSPRARWAARSMLARDQDRVSSKIEVADP